MEGGTFTITNTGSRGSLFDTPNLNYPQTAILGTGAVVERVVPLPSEDVRIGHQILCLPGPDPRPPDRRRSRRRPLPLTNQDTHRNRRGRRNL
ncbi:MAG: hypothetical protein C0488_07435 [Arthrobacter sp.]|nr:hypothetical protein [Arthrobacter sp.]